MELVPRYIEVVGRLRLSERARAKSVKNRQKAEEQKLKDQAQEAQWIKKVTDLRHAVLGTSF
jgi:DNA-directed RNA polymerase specialized sigma54-like protein